MGKHRKKALGCLALVGLLLLSGCGRKATADPAQPVTEQPATEQTQPRELSLTELMNGLLTVKEELKGVLEALENQDPQTARTALDTLEAESGRVGQSLQMTLHSLGEEKSGVKSTLENLRDTLLLMDDIRDQLLHPAVELIAEYPLSSLRQGMGIRVALLDPYLTFLEEVMPTLDNLLDRAQVLNLSPLDSDGSMAETLESFQSFLDLYHQDPGLVTRIKETLGITEDRTYLLVAQNSAEIRASGGFPGAMGVVRIENGVLQLEDFRKVYDVLSDYTPYQARLTIQENVLFHGGLSVPRDADFCPDFERVAYVWSLGYETRQDEALDGVISMTPAVVQRLLAALGEEITLSDGRKVNGENAVKALQHDLYFQYFGTEYVEGRYALADSLFADAARELMSCLLKHMDSAGLKACLSVAKESVADRTMLFWMQDTQTQALLQQLGCTGGLNSDPQKPQAGIYYNCTIASKMGWYLEMEASHGKPRQNEDGSTSYPITVVLSNIMTREELAQAGGYITGGASGAIEGSVYFFAPAGGTVADFQADNGVFVQTDRYHDLDLGFMSPFQIGPGKSVTITYTLTTAPGAGELTFSTTPTLKAYH